MTLQIIQAHGAKEIVSLCSRIAALLPVFNQSVNFILEVIFMIELNVQATDLEDLSQQLKIASVEFTESDTHNQEEDASQELGDSLTEQKGKSKIDLALPVECSAAVHADFILKRLERLFTILTSQCNLEFFINRD